MNSKVEIRNSAVSIQKSKSRFRKALLSPFLCSVLATIGVFGGISSLFAGLICVILHGVLSADKAFDRAGTFLLIIAIPMILIGSVFLDEIDTNK